MDWATTQGVSLAEPCPPPQPRLLLHPHLVEWVSALSETLAFLVSARTLDRWDLSATRRASVPAGADLCADVFGLTRNYLRTDDKSKFLDPMNKVWSQITDLIVLGRTGTDGTVIAVRMKCRVAGDNWPQRWWQLLSNHSHFASDEDDWWHQWQCRRWWWPPWQWRRWWCWYTLHAGSRALWWLTPVQWSSGELSASVIFGGWGWRFGWFVDMVVLEFSTLYI